MDFDEQFEHARDGDLSEMSQFTNDIGTAVPARPPQTRQSRSKGIFFRTKIEILSKHFYRYSSLLYPRAWVQCFSAL